MPACPGFGELSRGDVFGSGRGRDTMLAADPRLYELVRQVIPATKMPGNVYIGHTRATLPPKQNIGTSPRIRV